MTQKPLFEEKESKPVNVRQLFVDEMLAGAFFEPWKNAIEEKINNQVFEEVESGKEILKHVESFQVVDRDSRDAVQFSLNAGAKLQKEIDEKLKPGKKFLFDLHAKYCEIEKKVKADLVTVEEVGKAKIVAFEEQEKQRIESENKAKIAEAKAKQKAEQIALEKQAEESEKAEEKAALKAKAESVKMPLVELEEEKIKTEKVVQLISKSKLINLVALRGCLALSEEEKKALAFYGLKQEDIQRLVFAFALLIQIRCPAEFPPLTDRILEVKEGELKKAIQNVESGAYLYGQKVEDSENAWGVISEMVKPPRIKRS